MKYSVVFKQNATYAAWLSRRMNPAPIERVGEFIQLQVSTVDQKIVYYDSGLLPYFGKGDYTVHVPPVYFNLKERSGWWFTYYLFTWGQPVISYKIPAPVGRAGILPANGRSAATLSPLVKEGDKVVGIRLPYNTTVKQGRSYVARERIIHSRRRKRQTSSRTVRGPWSRNAYWQAYTDNTYAGHLTVYPLVQKSYLESMRTATSVRTPNFGHVRKSMLPINPYSMEERVVQNGVLVECVDLTLAGNPTQNTHITRMTEHYAAPAAPAYSAGVYNKALQRAITKAGAALEANVAQDFAQVGQTLRSIESAVHRLATSHRALKQGNIPLAVTSLWDPYQRHTGSRFNRGIKPRFRPGKKPKAGLTLAENWLELQYGWKPLLQDIRGAIEALARYNLVNLAVTQVNVVATSKEQRREPLYLFGYPSQKGGHRLIAERYACRIGLRYKVDDHLRAFLGQTGFLNPINLAWEILPYSFVVDWMLPIGPYLETLSSWDGLTFMDGYVTQFVKQNVASVVDFYGKPTGGGGAEADHTGSFSSEWTKMQRVKLTTFPTSSYPVLKNPFSTTHALNAVALLRSVMG